jgi:hypothetical protein
MNKKNLYRLIISAILAVFCLDVFADPPPNEPPNPPPATTVPKLIGTWKGVLYDARYSGYTQSPATDPEILKITDQKGKLFRGYQTNPALYGGTTFFIVGFIEDDGSITTTSGGSGGAIWHGRLIWDGSGGAPRRIEFHALNPDYQAAHIINLVKTTP